MKNARRIILVMACVIAGGVGAAGAQNAAPAPATMMPALPPVPAIPGTASANTNVSSGMSLPMPPPPALIPPAVFPTLPPSRRCTRQDILGIWKLLQVYEQPVDGEMSAFQKSPVQYLTFDDDDTFSHYSAGRSDLSIQGLRDAVKLQKKDLLQYVMGDQGMVYFYKNSVATDTQVCFIVANHLGNFLLGQMLMMPPEGQVQGRLVKVYTKVWQPAPPPKRRRGRRRP